MAKYLIPYSVDMLEACEPDALRDEDGVTVEIIPVVNHNSSGCPYVQVTADEREKLLRYVYRHWGADDAEWFDSYVTARVQTHCPHCDTTLLPLISDADESCAYVCSRHGTIAQDEGAGLGCECGAGPFTSAKAIQRHKAQWHHNLTAVVEQAKREVTADIASGRVPATVATFSELHDHIDANEYGGLCDEHASFSRDEAQIVQSAVDLWLRQGRP